MKITTEEAIAWLQRMGPLWDYVQKELASDVMNVSSSPISELATLARAAGDLIGPGVVQSLPWADLAPTKK